MSEIPKEWQKIDRWEAHVAWLKDQPTQMPPWRMEEEPQ